jgi:hypothetical protein
MKRIALFTAALLAAAGAQASCYTIMNAKGEILSQSQNPPVDMAYPLHETVPYVYGPGATMAFGIADSNCGDVIDPYYDNKSQIQIADNDGKAKAKAKRRGRKRAARKPPQ